MREQKQNTVLIADYFTVEDIAPLQNKFPQVTFVVLPSDGSVPATGGKAKVLLRAAMPKQALSRTLSDAPEIDWIHTSTAGFDWLFIPEVIQAVEAGKLTLTRSTAYSIAMGEFVIAAMFLLVKRLPAYIAAQADHQWSSQRPQELSGMTLGIIGAGKVGSEIATRAQALGMHVIGTRRTPVPVAGFEQVLAADQISTVLAGSDIVVLATPLTPETRAMINEVSLKLMKPTAYLINVGRGALIDQQALARALEEGWIAGGLLDVFEQEPLPTDSMLWDLPNLILTPHTSFWSPHNKARVISEFAENLQRYLQAEPLENRLQDLGLGY